MSASRGIAVRPDWRPLEIEFRSGAAAGCLQGGRAGLLLPLTPLAGDSIEHIAPDVAPQGEAHGFRLFAGGGLWIGCASRPLDGEIEEETLGFYRQLLRAAGKRRLYRIWNYVPAINRIEAGKENYRAFNAGRARAFAEAWGSGYGPALPAATAVGCEGGQLAAVFVAGDREPRHCENPEQIPAYRYPPEHGPTPPSFARATAVGRDRRRTVYISGTSAIKGHATVAPGSTLAQAECTIDNLRLISREAGAGSDLGAAQGWKRHFKIYLRHAEDRPAASALLGREIFQPGDRIAWLRADLCRAALNIEIDATLFSGADEPGADAGF